MKTIIIIIALVIILYLVMQMKDTSSPSSMESAPTPCPTGYVPSPVNSTWAGWNYNCLPRGIESSLVGIPSDTYVRPITTIYTPIIDKTGRAQSLMMGTPANLQEFPSQHDQTLFPGYK
jgi:hypothetical protein